MRALCASLPSDWWMTGDDGNRLALALCSVCPLRERCLEGDPEPHGVIRGGVAWGDDGRPRGLCGCGYPLPAKDGVERAECYRCEPRQNVKVPKRLRRKRPRGFIVPHLPRIDAWRAEGVPWEQIGKRLGMRKDDVRLAARDRPRVGAA